MYVYIYTDMYEYITNMRYPTCHNEIYPCGILTKAHPTHPPGLAHPLPGPICGRPVIWWDELNPLWVHFHTEYKVLGI